jgi:hypothetical protein
MVSTVSASANAFQCPAVTIVTQTCMCETDSDGNGSQAVAYLQILKSDGDFSTEGWRKGRHTSAGASPG